MASTASRLRRLVLSAAEVREMTSWPDRMIEDYLAILEDLITVANTIDTNMVNPEWVGLKGCSLLISGAGLSDPIASASYNVGSVVRTGVGVYLVGLIQPTFYGVGIIDNSTISTSNIIAPSVDTEGFCVDVTTPSASSIQLTVSELTNDGATITKTPYDLQLADTVSISLTMSSGEDLPPA